MATKGFIVRNAVAAGSNLDLAEPDALDFNLLSRDRYGVVEGCDNITIVGSVVTVTQGVVLINDALVATTSTQVTLPTSSQQPRFDLIAVDTGGKVIYVRGDPSPNPSFPEYGDDIVVLASVYITPGLNGPAQSDITDKRVFLSRRFLSTVTNGDLLASYATTPGLGKQFSISAQGRQEWTDVALSRSAASTLQVENNLNVVQKITADSAAINTTLTVTGDISAANLLRGPGKPDDPGVVAPGTPGDLFQDQVNGGLWSFEAGAWDKLSTTPIPPGSIMATLRQDEPAGWLVLNGRDVSKAASGGLWTAFPAWRKDANTLTLPQANGMFLRQGPIGSDAGAASVTLGVANMPPHKHLDSPTTEGGGSHTHTASTEGAGGHSHYTIDGQGVHHHDTNNAEHFHEGADGVAGGGFIAAFWGGTRRLDGPFNDASHPVSVEIVANTKPSPSHVQVLDGGAHQHYTNTEPPHTHPVTVSPFNSQHTHNVTERTVGGGQAFSIIPPFMAVSYLIKT